MWPAWCGGTMPIEERTPNDRVLVHITYHNTGKYLCVVPRFGQILYYTTLIILLHPTKRRNKNKMKSFWFFKIVIL